MTVSPQNCRIDHLCFPFVWPVQIDVLRLDLVHPLVSGNKWFKLKKYLAEAQTTGKKTLLTFGGAYSNNIVATAAAASLHNLKSVGVIRGEEPAVWSHTLRAARQLGMDLYYIARTNYKEKELPAVIFQRYAEDDIFKIAEGGYGWKGAEGAAEIFSLADLSIYTHIVTPVGTGTTLAGLLQAAFPHQKIIGIPVLRNAFSLTTEIKNLLPVEKHSSFHLVSDYHFGGYAKHTAQLTSFMNEIYLQHGLPTDFVYTGKALFAIFDMVAKRFFKQGDKVLFIHTGGLQGNGSLPKGTLIFDT